VRPLAIFPFCLALLATPARAVAQATHDAGGDVDTLRADAAQDNAAALASDCAKACRALEAMQHEAERICELDAGDPCAEAHDKVRDAAERVRAVCPGCMRARGVRDLATPTMAAEESSPSKRGGCAGCATVPRREHGGWSPFVAIALLAARRRRS